MRLGRGDRRGALRLSAFVSITLLASFTVAAHHVPGSEEVTLIFTLIAKSLLFGGTMWLFYIALEPYVRRQWPQTLIGWNRVLAGGWRDPLAGGDILIGVTGGALHGVLACIDAVLRMRAAEIPAELVERSTSPLIDARAGIASWLEWLQYSVHNAVWIFLFIFLLRIVLRKSWVAGLACVAVLAVTQTLRGGSMLAFDLPIWITIYAIGITTLLRFGLLAFTAVILCAMLLWTFPFDFSRWYAGSCLFVLLSLLALAMFAFHTTLAGRPVIRDDLLS